MSNNNKEQEIKKALDFWLFIIAFFVALFISNVKNKIKNNKIKQTLTNTNNKIQQINDSPVDIEKKNKMLNIVKSFGPDIVSTLKKYSNVFPHISNINVDVKTIKQINIDLDLDINTEELWKWDDKQDKMFYYWGDGLEKMIIGIKSKLYSNNIDVKKEKIHINAYLNCYKYNSDCKLVRSDCECWYYEPDIDIISGCLDWKPKIQSKSSSYCKFNR